MKSYPYPIPLEYLKDFCHPASGHELSAPYITGCNTIVGNGFVALKIARGAWLDSDLQEAPKHVIERFARLQWSLIDTFREKPDWISLDRFRPSMFSRGLIAPWMNDRPAPSPVWRVRDHLVRLTHLQMISPLPRVEVYHGRQNAGTPLMFRFSGGVGMIPVNSKLTIWSYAILQPTINPLSGSEMETATTAKPSYRQFKNWPPPEPQD